jgi:hypothetical protein
MSKMGRDYGEPRNTGQPAGELTQVDANMCGRLTDFGTRRIFLATLVEEVAMRYQFIHPISIITVAAGTIPAIGHGQRH